MSLKQQKKDNRRRPRDRVRDRSSERIILDIFHFKSSYNSFSEEEDFLSYHAGDLFLKNLEIIGVIKILAVLLTIGWTLIFPLTVIPHTFIDPSELKSGDALVGLTRMSHNRMHEFKLEILSVVLGRQPHSDMIWALIKDELLEETGVLAGMSGSPVYFNGRLVGAVAYTEGFLKKPIVGITPIKEMIAIKNHRLKEIDAPYLPLSDFENFLEDRKGFSSERIPIKEDKVKTLTSYYGLLKKHLVERPVSPPSQIDQGRSYLSTHRLQPILTPVDMTKRAWLPPAVDRSFPFRLTDSKNYFQNVFSGRSLSSDSFLLTSSQNYSSGPTPGDHGSSEKLVPGDLVGINLVRGDMNLSGYGTVTYISNDFIWAFGHPMDGTGSSRLPVYSATTEAVVPSQVVSYKMGRLGKEIGLLTQDRYSSILIERGKRAAYIPIKVSLQSPINHRTFNFEVVKDKNYFVYLASRVIASSLNLYDNKAATLEYSLQIVTDRQKTIEINHLLSNLKYDVGANLDFLLSALFSVLEVLEYNQFERVKAKEIKVTAKFHPQPRIKYIEDIRSYQRIYRPGDQVRLGLVLFDHQKQEEMETFYFQLPEEIEDGIYQIKLGNEQQRILEDMIYLWEGAEITSSIDEVFELLNLKTRFHYLNIWMLKPKPTLKIKKHLYTQLPVNQTRFMENSMVGRKLVFHDLLFQEKKLDHLVVGSASVEIEVKNQ